MPAGAKLLDVGSAAGFISAGMKDCGLSVTALEPNQSMAAYATDTLGLHVLHTDLENLNEIAAYDVVTMIQVVAHLLDPRKALNVAAQATRPGGYWLIEDWNANSIMARVRGKHWHIYNPPSVLQYFSVKSLESLATQCGFARIGMGRPRKFITAAHASGLLKFLGETSLLMKLAYYLSRSIPSNMTFPYPGDDIVWALYKKRS